MSSDPILRRKSNRSERIYTRKPFRVFRKLRILATNLHIPRDLLSCWCWSSFVNFIHKRGSQGNRYIKFKWFKSSRWILNSYRAGTNIRSNDFLENKFQCLNCPNCVHFQNSTLSSYNLSAWNFHSYPKHSHRLCFLHNTRLQLHLESKLFLYRIRFRCFWSITILCFLWFYRSKLWFDNRKWLELGRIVSYHCRKFNNLLHRLYKDDFYNAHIHN